MRIPILLSGLMLVLPTTIAHAADDTYLLQAKVERGQVRQLDVEAHRHTVRTTVVNGTARPKFDENIDAFFKAVVTLAEVKDGSPIAAIVDVDPTSHNVTTDAPAPPVTDDAALAGKKFAIRRDDDNTFTSDYKGVLSDADWGILKPVLTPGSTFLPDHPIAIGDEWNPTKTLKPFLIQNPADDATETCKLAAVKIENGHHIAEIAVTLTETRHLDLGVQVDFKDNSTLRFDIDAGRSLGTTSQITGTISTPPGAVIQVNGTITESVETKAKDLPAGAADATTGPATMP